MDIEAVNKYLNKRVKLILKSNYYYVGEIKKIYDSSFDFVDVKGNELTQDIESVSTIQFEREHNATQIQKEGKSERNNDTKKYDSKKPFVMTEEMAVSWASENPTENQIKTLKKMGYEDSDIDELSKLDCWKIINDESKNKTGEYL